MPASTLSSWALLVWEELNARQLDAQAIFQAAGLAPSKLSNTVARFPLANMTQLWDLAAQASGDDGFGIAALGHRVPAVLDDLHDGRIGQVLGERRVGRAMRRESYILRLRTNIAGPAPALR